MKLYVMARTWIADQSGQDLIEFTLIAGLVALAAIAAITTASGGVNGVWTGVSSAVDAVPIGAPAAPPP